MKHLKLPCQFSKFTTEDDRRLFKCKLRVQHDLDNVNGSYFDLNDIKTMAYKTLRNTPILGSVVYDEDLGANRLNGHDMDYEIVDTEDGIDIKVSYIERVYGYIPNDAPIEFEYDEEMKRTYLVTYGYLWKNYLDEVAEILDRNDNETTVSMEIEVDKAFEREDGLLQITDYIFNGVCMIGIKPGMTGSNLKVFSKSKNMSSIKSEMEELYKTYSLEKEENMSKELEEQVIEVIEPATEVVQDIVEETVEEVIEVQTESEEFESDDKEKRKYEDEEYELLQSEFNALKESYSELERKLNEMFDYEELKEFKSKYDEAKFNQEVEDAAELFDLDEEEVSELKEKVFAKEITIEQFKEKLGYKFAMKQLENKKFSKKETQTSEVQVVDNIKVSSKYGELGKKYSK